MLGVLQFEHFQNGRTEIVQLRFRNHESIHAVVDCFGNPPGIAGNHNPAAGHCFQNGIRQSVPNRRLQNDVAELKMTGDVALMLQPPCHHNSLCDLRMFGGERRQVCLLPRPDLADHKEAGWPRLLNFEQRRKNEGKPFLVSQFATESQHRLIRPDPQRGE